MEKTEQRAIYAEIYKILNLLGKGYIERLPKKLYEIVENERLMTYNPNYDIEVSLLEQDVRRETIAMLALFHLNYWCETEEEKNNLRQMFIENREKKIIKENEEKELKKQEEIKKAKEQAKEKAMIEYQEQNILNKIFSKVKTLFKQIGKGKKVWTE